MLQKPDWLNKALLVGVCSAAVMAFAVFYFSNYANPYMEKNIIDISEQWDYTIGNSDQINHMKVLQQVGVNINEALILYRTLKEEIPDAYIMFKRNHQNIRVFLDNDLIFETVSSSVTENPGIGLCFISLPTDYIGKTIKIEITSPYSLYSGAPSSIILGDFPSLMSYAMKHSILHTLLMVICLSAGIFLIILSLLHNNDEKKMEWGAFAFGVFSILWGFYFPSTDYITQLFFSPKNVSIISIGLYFLYPFPLMVFFYYQFIFYRKLFLPVVVLRGIFVALAFILQYTGKVDFPEMLNINNPIYILSVLFLVILGMIESIKGNQFMRFAVFWVAVAFLISVKGILSFYTTRISQDEAFYGMAVFGAIIVVWLYKLKELFQTRARERSNIRVLELKNESALRSYENARKYMEHLKYIRHEAKNHIAAVQILLEDKEYDKIEAYLLNLADKHELISQEFYCEHSLVNAILNMQFSILKEKGIKISYNISLPNDLKIPDTDLCSLIMNILNNAVEALDKIDDDQDKFMDMKIKVEKSYLYIYCRNSKANEGHQKKEDFRTTKKDKENHGYGLKIIQSIVKRMNGFININTDHYFTIELAIKEEEE